MASISPTLPLISIGASTKKTWIHNNQKAFLQLNSTSRLEFAKTKAAAGNKNSKPNSVICADCDGNGRIVCSQCQGSGVNAVDLFNGQFKAGDSCWICGGKNDMLCGNCNGAGFVGGFLSTYDE